MERLKGVSAVICEFNPFHSGHRHLLERAREQSEYVFGIMSGNLIQRGGNACADKYLRAAAAVECGYDGVLSLPFPFCSLSAKDFARAGVFIAEETGIETLVFGAEDPEAVQACAAVATEADFDSRVTALIKERKNLSYPKAVHRILCDSAGTQLAELISKPNNILALEYIKALSKRGILKYRVIQRSPEHASAGSLRKAGVPADKLPDGSGKFFEKTVADGALLEYGLVAAKLYSGDKAMLYGIDESLAGRITKACRDCGSVEEFLLSCRSANDTDARIRRALVSILFGITKYRAAEMPSFTLLLACGERGRAIIKKMKKCSGIKFGVKPSVLTGDRQFEGEVRAERVLRVFYGTPDPMERTPYIKGEDK